MKFNHHHIDLPIKEIIEDVRRVLHEKNTLIVNAPAGAGKSTILPLVLMEKSWLNGKKIIMLEPRRLAAKTIAWRMSDLLNDETGNTVGFRIRFENKVSAKTRIEIVTEGILTRMLHSDNSLGEVGMVIFDEFHERSIYADVALALCREAQQVLRPDLRIMIMSATLDTPGLSKLLDAQVIISKGRQYPVEIKYSGVQDEMMLPELTARLVVKVVHENEGDVLVFLPGEGEIKKCEAILKKSLPGFAIHPLYGQLPKNKQYAAIMPNKNNKRKVVLATSIAETSLTIEGIKNVVDSGFGRTSQFDPKTGLSRLKTITISKDSADQRAGRAGRLSPGTCYRMWTKASHERLAEQRTPEIMEADLAPLVLDMAKWGVTNIYGLTWLSPPPQAHLQEALETLHQIEALENNKITQHGLAVHSLPCHPRIAHMLLKAKDENLLNLATDIAAILEERDPLPRETGIDINLRIEALRQQRNSTKLNRQMGFIEKIASQYRQMFNIKAENTLVDPYETGMLLVYAYPERIAHARPGNNAQFQMANGKYAMAGHKDDLAHEPWLAIAHVNAQEERGRIFLASPLNPTDLSHMVKEKEIVQWDYRNDQLKATRDLSIGSIVLKSTPLPNPGNELVKKAIMHAIQKEELKLLNFENDVLQWLNRVNSLRTWRPDENWPDVTTLNLINNVENWLAPYLDNIKTAADLKKLNILEILQHLLTWQQQQHLEKLAPQKIQVPSGSNIKITYHENGNPPILAVRIQEIFGMAKTPCINDGKTPLLLHLLSPGFKPVQVTTDLDNFWKNTYFDVRKDLKGRYPKHPWPDNPTEAKAVIGVKRKR